MPSPFPGMDPYIEDPEIWSDFHSNLAMEIQSQLNRTIQPHYVARLTPRVTYEIIEIAKTQSIRPDVGIWQPQPSSGQVRATAIAIPSAPIISTVKMEIPLRLVNVEVRKTGTLELVTAIEILSLVNKQPSHDAYQDYQRKRRELLRSSCPSIGNRPTTGWTTPTLRGTRTASALLRRIESCRSTAGG